MSAAVDRQIQQFVQYSEGIKGDRRIELFSPRKLLAGLPLGSEQSRGVTFLAGRLASSISRVRVFRGNRSLFERLGSICRGRRLHRRDIPAAGLPAQ